MQTSIFVLSRVAIAATVFIASGVSTLRADTAPDPQTLLKNARMAQIGQQRTLKGHLRVQSTGKVIPFTLILAGDTIRYEFADKAIILKLGETASQFTEAADGDARKVSPARYDNPVEGTDITYEDLSLKFLYWPKAKMDGTDTVGLFDCWKMHLEPAAQSSSYSAVELWVNKSSGDFVKGEGYDKSGTLVKEFNVRSGQRDPQGGWMLKTMRIETLFPGKPETVTYLEIDK